MGLIRVRNISGRMPADMDEALDWIREKLAHPKPIDIRGIEWVGAADRINSVYRIIFKERKNHDRKFTREDSGQRSEITGG